MVVHKKDVSLDSESYQVTVLMRKNNYRDMGLYHKVDLWRESFYLELSTSISVTPDNAVSVRDSVLGYFSIWQ